MNNDYKKFYTSDFYLACYIYANKIKLLDIDKTNPQRASFIFKDSQQRKEIAEEYIFNNGQIEPKAFTSAIKELKQLLYSNIN